MALALTVGVLVGCASWKASPVSSGDVPTDFELNFAGVCAKDWPGSFRFYTETLGIRAHSQDGHWAMLGTGWERYCAGQSRGLVFELFEGGGHSSEADASEEQAIRLGIQVRDLAKTVASASARGVRFVTPIETKDGQQRAEFIAPEGRRWILQSASDARTVDDLSEPEITLAEMRVQNLRGQITFYRDALSMRIVEQRVSRAVLQQVLDGPRLVLKTGGRKHIVDPKWADQPALSQPVFLSFKTRNMKTAAARLQHAGIRTLHGVEHHDWGGTDLIVADADGNAVQIVEYDEPRSYGSRR